MKTIEELIQENSLASNEAVKELRQAGELFADLLRRTETAKKDLYEKYKLNSAVMTEQEMLVKIEEKDIAGIAALIGNCRQSFLEKDFYDVVGLLTDDECRLLSAALKKTIKKAESVVDSIALYIETHQCQEAFTEALEISRGDLLKNLIADEIVTARIK